MLQCVMEYFKYSPPETLLYDVRNLKLECVPGVERYILVSGGTNGNWQWHNNGCGELVNHTLALVHICLEKSAWTITWSNWLARYLRLFGSNSRKYTHQNYEGQKFYPCWIVIGCIISFWINVLRKVLFVLIAWMLPKSIKSGVGQERISRTGRASV